MLESPPLPAPALRRVEDPVRASADVLVVGLTEDLEPSPTLREIDQIGGGTITRLIERAAVSGKRGQSVLLASPADEGPSMVLVIGLGPRGELSRQVAFEAASTAVRKLTDRPRSEVHLAIAESFPASTHDALVAGAVFACETQAIYHTEPGWHVPETIGFGGIQQETIDRGSVIGQAVNQARRLVNEPPAMMYPETFANRSSSIAAEAGLEIEIWDESRLAAEGCRAILAVGSGSIRPPRLVMLRHSSGGDEPPIVLVGKGVTFDSGGLSIKPSEGMVDMKCDMAGAATVVGVMQAIAKLGVRRNVIGLCGLAENMVSGTSYKLGDVIETRSGKTIEIRNTDAEGRVVLADVLDVALQQQPASIVDLATLTGACVVALGNDVAGLMTNRQTLCDAVAQAAGFEGEPVWQLPMFELYDEQIKSKIADIRNVGEGRWGGAITAAKFLQQFVDDVPWLHIDIAGPAFADRPKPHRDAGATGALVRSLIRWLEVEAG